MIVDWERVAKTAGKIFLLFLEYCIKLSAMVVTAVVLSAEGTFGMKLGTGYGSISSALRNLFSAPGDILNTAYVIHDYNTMTAAAFNEAYGARAIDGALAYLNSGIMYVQEVLQNFANQPFATFFAALISFCSLYFLSLVIRFARQKGQGSYINRLERKLADHVFEPSKKLNNPPSEKKKEPSPQPKKKEKNLFNKKSEKVNSHLQDYMRSVQGG